MSFVLDALKVSERRRARFSRRVYAHPPRPRRADRRRNWLVALVVPGAIALAMAGWNLVAPAPGPLSPPASADNGGAPFAGGPSKDSSVAPAPARSVAALADSPMLDIPGPAGAVKMGVSDEPGEAAAANKSASGKPAPAGAATGTEPRHESSGQIKASALPAADGSTAQNPASRPVSTQDALAAAPTGWPTLSLQMLFFSEDENRSFVQVNGRTYRQGEQLAAGPQVLMITRDAVTLSHRGQLLVLGAER